MDVAESVNTQFTGKVFLSPMPDHLEEATLLQVIISIDLVPK